MTAEQISALGRTLFAGLATGLGGLLVLFSLFVSVTLRRMKNI